MGSIFTGDSDILDSTNTGPNPGGLILSSACCFLILILVVCIFFPSLLPFQVPWNQSQTLPSNPFSDVVPKDIGVSSSMSPSGVTWTTSTSIPTASPNWTSTPLAVSPGSGKVNDVCKTNEDCSSGCCAAGYYSEDGRPRCAPAGSCSNEIVVNQVVNTKWCNAAAQGMPPWIQVFKHPSTGYAACIGPAPNNCAWRPSATDYTDLALIKKVNDSNGLKCTQLDIGNPQSWCYVAQATLDKKGEKSWNC